MARLTTYQTDTDVQGNDRVLGTDSGGATKNYTLDSVGKYFTKNNVVKVGGQIVYMFTQSPNDFTDGQFMLSSNGGAAAQFLDVQSLYINKNAYSGDNITLFLNRLFNNQFMVYSVDDPNTYATFNVQSIDDDDTGLTIGITCAEANGDLVHENFYTFSYTDSDKAFVFNQGVPSTEWVITHNLQKQPSVTVVDSSGNLVMGSLTYNSENQLTLNFSRTVTGKAYLN